MLRTVVGRLRRFALCLKGWTNRALEMVDVTGSFNRPLEIAVYYQCQQPSDEQESDLPCPKVREGGILELKIAADTRPCRKSPASTRGPADSENLPHSSTLLCSVS